MSDNVFRVSSQIAGALEEFRRREGEGGVFGENGILEEDGGESREVEGCSGEHWGKGGLFVSWFVEAFRFLPHLGSRFVSLFSPFPTLFQFIKQTTVTIPPLPSSSHHGKR